MALIGNKVIEKDLRDYLENSGYRGRSAEFSHIDLVAVQRPGWLQVFSFDVRAKTQTGEWTQLYGACRDDERYKRFEVVLCDSIAERDSQLADLSTGLITLQRKTFHGLLTGFLLLFIVLVLLIFAGVIIRAIG